uniref:Uncharacterized protein n=1 Tax=Anguilla anguilla TaxID=7936 RepID=A0A0E9XDQ0_ANGAN
MDQIYSSSNPQTRSVNADPLARRVPTQGKVIKDEILEIKRKSAERSIPGFRIKTKDSKGSTIKGF